METLGVGRYSHIKLACFVGSIFLLYGQSSCTGSNVVMKSNAITSTRDGRKVPLVHRVKRSLFSEDMKQKLVDKHDNLRRQEGASDMEKLTWNDYLASMAEDWAKQCNWQHGQPSRPDGEPPYDPLGQNMYVGTGTFDALNAIQAFYDEKEYYDYDTGSCSNDPCGHYTQVVWSMSREVGCAYVFCTTMTNVNLNDATFMVCNYGPAGNYVGKKPFKKGAACTQCSSGKFWCDDGLCRADCTAQSTTCECAADCKNCATTVPSNCSCACTPGWTGVDCSEPCEDTKSECGANPGWPVSWCEKSFVYEGCPAMCSLCTPGTNENMVTCETTAITTTATTTTTTTTTTDVVSDNRNGASNIYAQNKLFLTAVSMFYLLK